MERGWAVDENAEEKDGRQGQGTGGMKANRKEYVKEGHRRRGAMGKTRKGRKRRHMKLKANGRRIKRRGQKQKGDETMEKCGKERTRVGKRNRDKKEWKVGSENKEAMRQGRSVEGKSGKDRRREMMGRQETGVDGKKTERGEKVNGRQK